MTHIYLEGLLLALRADTSRVFSRNIGHERMINKEAVKRPLNL